MDRSERADHDPGLRVSEPQETVSIGVGEVIDGYLVPVDPMDGLQCESCQ